MVSCRVCLSKPANHDMFKLRTSRDDGGKSYSGIFQFCLDIKVTKDSKITHNLCEKCCHTLLQFYKFKILAIQNDVYLKTIGPECEDGEPVHEEEVFIVLATDNETNYVENIVEISKANKVPNTADADHDTTGNTADADCGAIDTEVIEDIAPEEDTIEPLEDSYIVDSNLVEYIDENEQNFEVDNIECMEPDYDQDQESVKTEDNMLDTDSSLSLNKNETHVLSEKGGQKYLKKIKLKKSDYECIVRLPNEMLKKRRKQEGPSVYDCPYCPVFYHSKSSLRKHKQKKHMPPDQRKWGHCDVCDKDVKDLELHTALYHDRSKLKYACEKCHRRFYKQTHLLGHMCRDSKSFPYDCPHCDKRFKTRHGHREHIKAYHTQPKKFQCDICSKWFPVKALISRHMMLEHLEKKYKCHICEKGFPSPSNMTHHMISHTKVRDIRCDMCDDTFKRVGELTKHIRKKHSNSSFGCTFCKRVFVTESLLTKHVQRDHAEQKQYKCDICDKLFTRIAQLEAHRYTHGGREYSCGECPRLFKSPYNLAMHFRRIHERQKDHLCHHCSKSFFSKTEFTEHLRAMHSDRQEP